MRADERLLLLLEHKSILSSLFPLPKTIAPYKEESSVCMSMNVREILTGNTERKSVRVARQCEAMRWTESYFPLHSHATVRFLDHADIVSSIP